jgi:short-subunit dehydrogenase|tara:strand:+ start:22 stop:807 length:786 start_codon:yes stop_codon:yes gene_type:complete
MNYTLITGASNGIGKEMAIRCAQLKMNLLLVSLPNENVGDLSKELSAKYIIETDFYECNLTDTGVPEGIINWTKEKGYNVNFLINNAGFGGVGAFEEHNSSYVHAMIDLNVKATTLLTHIFIPELKKNTPSYLLNTSSMAANFPVPYKAMYAASKIYVKNFTIALREELKKYDIQVCLLQPGATPTNDVVKTQIKTGGAMAKISVMLPEDVAHYAIKRTMQGRAIAIPGFKNRLSLFIAKFLPRKMKLNMAVKVGETMIDN